MEMGRSVGSSGITNRLVEYVLDRPKQVLYRAQIASDLGLTEQQVMSAFQRMRETAPLLHKQIKVVVRGSTWQYAPSKPQKPVAEVDSEAIESGKPTPMETTRQELQSAVERMEQHVPVSLAGQLSVAHQRMTFVQIHQTASGAVLLEDAAGDLWKAVRV